MTTDTVTQAARTESSSSLAHLTALLEPADIRINGSRPWDLQLHNPAMINRVFAQGSLGLGESYMDGDWDCRALDQFFERIFRHQLDQAVVPWRTLLFALRSRLFNRQTARRAFAVGEQHYDLGNDFYAAMLDARMTYTCGYWRNATTLDEAQEAKLDLCCQKLQLRPGLRVLDIGCGWGSFARYAAEHYGVEVVGLTIAQEQAKLAREHCRDLPVEIRLQDYRDCDERFDRIVSIGMFEHVGHKNYRTFMAVANRCLHPQGLMLLHTIGKNGSDTQPDPWIDKYIFPNGEIPSFTEISAALERLFVIEDVQNIGAHYDPTLMAWYANVERHWPQFSDRYGERFRRMWRYYLLLCAGLFRARTTQVWQWVLSPQGVTGGYLRPNQ